MAARNHYEPVLERDKAVVTTTSSDKEQNEATDGDHNYKPFPLRLPSLTFLFLVTLALIGLLEYAARSFPHQNKLLHQEVENPFQTQRSPEVAATKRAINEPRQATSSAAASAYVSVIRQITNTTTSYTDIEPVSSPPESAAATAYVGVQTPVDVSATQTQTASTANTAATQTQILSPVNTAYVPLGAYTTDDFGIAHWSTPLPTTTASTAYVPTQAQTGEPPTAPKATAYVPQGDSAAIPAGSREGTGLTLTEVFLSRYLSVLLAVAYRILLSVVYNSYTLIDPFRQMATTRGASAESALLAFYHQQSTLLGPIRALMNGRLTLAMLAIAGLLVCFLPALASETIWVDTHWDCPAPTSGANPCPPRVKASMLMVRSMQGLLGLCALVIAATVVALWRTQTGLTEDPSSIAAISRLMGQVSLQKDVRATTTSPNATASGMKRILHRKQYKLGTWREVDGVHHYGIHPVDARKSWVRSLISEGRGQYAAVRHNGADTKPSGTRKFRLLDILLLIVIAGAFAVITAYYFDGSNDDFNRFFSSSSFGPRFLLTGAGTVIATLWKSAEQHSMIMAPFCRMASRPACARDSVNFQPTTTPLVSTFISIRSGYWLTVVITIAALLAEALNVMIGGVPFRTGQTFFEFLLSAKMSMCSLGILMPVSVAIIVRRIREPRMPVFPDTIAGKMFYLADSSMLRNAETKDHLKQEGFVGVSETRDELRYHFVPKLRKDGSKSWTVEEVHSAGIAA